VTVVSSSNLQVRDCEIRQIGGDQGVALESCTDAEVSNCRLRSIDGGAVLVFGAGTARVTVRDNDILNCSDGAIFVFGDDSLIANNVTDVTNGGISIRGTGTTVRDNVIRSSLDAGIRVDQATQCVITNNRVREFNQQGIALEGTTSDLDVTDNVITDGRVNSNAAIEVGCSNSRILRNRAVRCGEGFFVSGDNCALRDNVVKSSLQDGFDFATSAAICVLDNDTAVDCAAEGLDNSGSGTKVTNCTFKNCRIDVANDGSFQLFSGNTFVTGGQATPPEID
ncbi:MAG TPA: right-handed parallel beta-helix repeat-containing protein, partial [Pirellulaceae bacterium]|nr:right-handed parallel beta-helix repeat-containing protein [Pirellulaceae bacterium]